MPKIAISTQGLERVSATNFLALRELVNGGLGVDNFQGRVLSGTTNAIADTSILYKHSLNPPPVGAIALIGDVYIAAIGTTYIDIRSRFTAHPFSIYLLSGKL